ncbi:MAG TPA: hypothetical protein VIM30_15650 [Candidatus Limnocylindrales bacterium]
MLAPAAAPDAPEASHELTVLAANGSAHTASGHANGHSNGVSNGRANGVTTNGASATPVTLNLGGTRVAFAAQADAPSCADCGAIMVRNGSCYKCLNCGSTSGCS